MTEAQIQRARFRRQTHKESYRQIAQVLGVHESTVRRALKKTATPTKRRVTIIVIEETV